MAHEEPVVEGAEATSCIRNKLWKRLRFWGGIFLVVVVGISILAYVTYRKALGPPPTPPGKSPEFDQHLAEIDKDWLFLVQDRGKLVLTDIHGEDITVLLDFHEAHGKDRYLGVVVPSVSPNGQTVTMPYHVVKDFPYLPIIQGYIFVDMKTCSVKRFVGEETADWICDGPLYWLSDDVALGLFRVLYGSGSRAPDGAEMIRCIRFDVTDIANPEYFELPFATNHGYLKPTFDGDARVLLFRKSTTNGGTGQLLAYDIDGLRSATAEEERNYGVLSKESQAGNGTTAQYKPRIELVDPRKHSSLWNVLPRFKGPKSRTRELRLNGRLVRVMVWDGDEIFTEPDARWCGRFDLLSWREGNSWGDFREYLADIDGHYRFWHRGSYWGKIPRWKGESEEAGER